MFSSSRHEQDQASPRHVDAAEMALSTDRPQRGLVMRNRNSPSIATTWLRVLTTLKATSPGQHAAAHQQPDVNLQDQQNDIELLRA